MLLSTRDAQRERRNSYTLAAAAVVDTLSRVGIDNASFRADSVLDLRNLSRVLSQVDVQSRPLSPKIIRMPEDSVPPPSETQSRITTLRERYHWRMTHYFYIHMSLFIINGLLCGLIIYLIENYSSSRNIQMKVEYIDAWFVSSSCVCSCGLTTIDFAKLSRASQIILMFFTFISGITISTLPALVVKAQTHRKIQGMTVDDDHGEIWEDFNDELPTVNIRLRRNLPQNIRNQLNDLPTPAQLRYRAYITCIILILGTCFTIYLISFIAIGSWLTDQYKSEQLMQGNTTINPWYISFIVVVTGFNQNGLIPFSDGFARFIHDVYLNLFVMIVVISGTSLFPFILRNVVIIAGRLAPFRHQVIFDYILMNNHRLSTLLFPAVQTRIYLLVTFILYILGVSISLILDLHNENLAMYPSGTRVLIFLFHTVNSRFAGFQTFDLNSFATATLLVYLMLMATKPQMLCALDESPFELSWLAVQARDEVDARTNSVVGPENGLRSPSESILSTSTTDGLPLKQMHRFLRRQSLVTKDLARKQFATTARTSDAQSIKLNHIRRLRIRLFLIYFIRTLIKHAFSFLVLTRTWLFFFIFLICAIENRRMAPIDPNITIFKIIFEIVSAFGTVGFSLGYPNISSSFSSVLSPASKTILIFTMLMGRHRGLLASMKDQEEIEHSAADLLIRRRENIIHLYEETQVHQDTIPQNELDEKIVRF